MESLDECQHMIKIFKERNPTITTLLAVYEQGHEPGDNPHMHIQMISLRDRNFVRRTLKGESPANSVPLVGHGNQSYSIGDPEAGTNTWEKGLQYVCKGYCQPYERYGPTVVDVVGEGIDPAALHAAYLATASVQREAATEAHRVSGNRIPMLDAVRKLYEEHQPQTAQDWCTVCLDFYRDLPYNCNYNSFQDCVRKVGVENFHEIRNAQEAMLYRKLMGDVMNSMM